MENRRRKWDVYVTRMDVEIFIKISMALPEEDHVGKENGTT